MGVPDGWSLAPVSKFGEVLAGKAKNKNGSGVLRSYLRVANVFDGHLVLNDVLTMPFTDEEFTRYRLKSGDILLNEGQSRDLVGRCSMYRGEFGYPCAIQNALIRFRSYPHTSAEFAEQLFRWCQQSGVFAALATQTTSIAHLGVKRFSELGLLMPPLGEQRKIAEILGSVDEAIQATQAVIEQTRKVKQGLLQQLLTRGIGHTRFKQTEIGEIPESWEVMPMAELAAIERGRFSHRPRNDPRFYNGSYPFVQTGDVTACDGRIENHSQTLNAAGLAISQLFPAGTIVLTIAANIAETGIATYPVAFPDSLVGIQPGSRVTNVFLELVLRGRKQELVDAATQSAQKNINLAVLRPFLVQVPPLEEQKLISSTLESVRQPVRAGLNTLSKLTQLKTALMSELLTGRTRVKVIP